MLPKYGDTNPTRRQYILKQQQEQAKRKQALKQQMAKTAAQNQAPETQLIQKQPSLTGMVTDYATNKAIGYGVDKSASLAEPYIMKGLNAGKSALTNMFAPSAAQSALTIGGAPASAAGGMAASPGMMSTLGPIMATAAPWLVGGLVLSKFLSRGGYIGPLSKKG